MYTTNEKIMAAVASLSRGHRPARACTLGQPHVKDVRSSQCCQCKHVRLLVILFACKMAV